MSDKKITLHADFKQIGGNFKKARKELMKSQDDAQKFIMEETKNEKKELEDAYKKYINKLEKVLKKKEFKEIEDKSKKLTVEVSKNLLKAKKEFLRIKDEIMKQNWSKEKKMKKIDKIHNYIMAKLYDKKEIEQFNKLISQVMIIPSKNNKEIII